MMKVSACGGNANMGSRRTVVQLADAGGNPKFFKTENFLAEREKFLQDFEKPTQIYRFLRARMLNRPTFLFRNLSYMPDRLSRPRRPRSDFKVGNLMEIVKARQEKDKELAKCYAAKQLTKNFLNVIILGFCDGHNWLASAEAKLDLQIVRICMKKRKESQIPISKAFSASCSVKVHSPSTESIYDEEQFTVPICKGKYPVIAVPKDCFNLVNGHIVQSLRLVVRITVPLANLCDKKDEDQAKDHHSSGGETVNGSPGLGVNKLTTNSNLVNSKKVSTNSNSNASSETDEPKPKRHRSLPTKDRENFVYETQNKNGTRNGNNNVVLGAPQELVYTGVLNIYDKDANVNIPAQGNVDLEFILQKQQKKSSIPAKRITREQTWENAADENPKFQDYMSGGMGTAKLALALRSSNEKMEPFVDPPPRVIYGGASGFADGEDNQVARQDQRVVYQFIHNSSGRQMTESRLDLRCPWCSINCLKLYSLLQHLKACHPRFNFSFLQITNGARVDVSINEGYDGSYSGSAFDLVAQPPGEAFARNGPAKRTQVFEMIVFKHSPMKQSIQEFFESDEKDAEQRRSYITGHNRLYHHTTTCLPIHPREIDVDSEGEPDPEWLRVKTCMMIDEFTDVNEGEKEIMKMWNHHVMHDNYVGDCQIPLACKRFVDKYGREIIQKNLYRNFILHLTNLYDFGLLPAQEFHATVQALHFQMKDENTASSLRDSWRAYSTAAPGVIPTHTNGNGVVEDMEVEILTTSRVNPYVRLTNGPLAITAGLNGHQL